MIHALPGMGADHRMFPAPWSELPGFIEHDWIRHSGEKTLAEAAESMCKAYGIRDGDTIVGSSLGGMVGCEITKIRRIRALYLVGSAVRKEEVNRFLAALHPLAPVAPFEVMRFAARKLPFVTTQMFGGVDTSFVRAMCGAVFRWKGLEATDTKVFRIHGRHDHVISCPPKADLLIKGGHLISMTHAEVCAEFVKQHTIL